MNTENTSEHAAVAEVEQNQFVTVPGRTLSDGTVVAAFKVGKYMSSLNADGGVTISADAVPTVHITYFDAVSKAADAGLALLTLSQSVALALDVAEQGANWSGGVVGEGDLMQGLHLGTVRGAVDGNHVSSDERERRGFTLSNGEVIFDVAGHLYTWLRDDIQGDDKGLTDRAFAENSPAVCAAPFPSMERGVGWYPDAGDDWSGGALVRGGCWYSRSSAGVFDVYYVSPDFGYSYVGFRCTTQ